MTLSGHTNHRPPLISILPHIATDPSLKLKLTLPSNLLTLAPTAAAVSHHAPAASNSSSAGIGRGICIHSCPPTLLAAPRLGDMGQ